MIIGKVVCEEIPELNSNHEEADTKLLLHAKHASETGEASIVIKSFDTGDPCLSLLQGYTSTDPHNKEGENEKHLSGDFYHS